MLSSNIFDVVIGLAYIYLVLSLIVSAASEAITSALRWRGRLLWRGIRDLIGAPLAKALYAHPLVMKVGATGRAPSYISARTFSLALLDMIAPADAGATRMSAQIASGIADMKEGKAGDRAEAKSTDGDAARAKRILTVLFEDAGLEPRVFQAKLESWFDESMQLVSGWYKRWTQLLLLTLGFAAAVVANVDTIAVVNGLAASASVREAIVKRAEGTVAASHQQSGSETELAGSPTTALKRYAAELSEVQELGLPIGWNGGVLEGWESLKSGEGAGRVLGWLLTAFAVSLGAPFWFDLLNKFVNLRGTGKPPPAETDRSDKPVGVTVTPAALSVRRQAIRV